MHAKRVLDLVIVCLVFVASIAIGSGAFNWPSLTEILVARIKVSNLFLLIGYLALCSAIFSACGFYQSHRLSHRKHRLYEVLLAVTLLMGVLLVLGWPLDLSFATKEFLLVFWLLCISILMLSHELAQQLLHLARLHGRNLRRVVIVGEEDDAMALANVITHQAGFGYYVVQVIDAREMAKNAQIASDIPA
jgi:FlaA1/EpsC-like NDP-sugar epimerase